MDDSIIQIMGVLHDDVMSLVPTKGVIMVWSLICVLPLMLMRWYHNLF